MQQNQLEAIRVRLEHDKAAFEMQIAQKKFENDKQMALLEHELKVREIQLEHERGVEELRHKYHQTAITDQTERVKIGDTPERKDAFKQSIDALLDAIRNRRWRGTPPDGGSVQ